MQVTPRYVLPKCAMHIHLHNCYKSQELVLQTKSKTVNLHECKCWANRMGNSGLDSIFISRFTRVLAAAAV